MDDRCQMCRGRVYLLERHYTPTGRLYHRHCYRGYQRTSALQKSKPHSSADQEKPTTNGSALPSEKTGLESSAKDTQCVQSSGSSTARDSGLTAHRAKENTDNTSTSNGSTQGLGKTGLGSFAKGTGYVQSSCSSSPRDSGQTDGCGQSVRDSVASVTTDVSSRKPLTSTPGTGLIKALYSTPNYGHRDATAGESATPTASHVSATAAGRLKAVSTLTPSSVASSSSLMSSPASSSSSSSSSSVSIPVSAASHVSATAAGRLKAVSTLTPSSAVAPSSSASIPVSAARSHVNTAVGGLRGTSSPSSSSSSSAAVLTEFVPVSLRAAAAVSSSSSSSMSPASTAVSPLTRSDVLRRPIRAAGSTLTSSPQSVVAAARSQYLERVGAAAVSNIRPVPPAAVTTSTAINYRAGKATSTTSEASSSAAVSSQPLISSVAAEQRSQTTDERQPKLTKTSETVASYKPFTDHSSSGSANVAGKPLLRVTNANINWSAAAVSNGSSTTSSHRPTTSSRGGYVSPFLSSDRMLTAAVTTAAPVRPVASSAIKSTLPVTSSYQHNTSPIKSTLMTSLRPVTASQRVTSVQQRRSAEHAVDATDSAMLNSILQTLGERKQQQGRPPSTSAAVQSAGTSRSAAPATLSTARGGKMTTANRRASGTATAGDKAEWQLEAQRRQAARKGVYVDPEKKHQTAAIQRLIDRQQWRPDVYDASKLPSHTAQKTPANERE